MKNLENQTIALAAIYQSCYIIKEIAWTGKFNEKDLEILISAIFITNPSSVYNVFNNIRHLDTGFKFLKDQLNGNNINEEAKEYFAALVQLSKGLEKNETITAKIQEELLVLKSSFSNEEIDFGDKSEIDNQSLKISTLYTDTLSKIEPRIIIIGDNQYLKDPLVAAKIRTSLFAGLRSVFLWKNFGGSNIKNFFYKSNIINEIDRLLAT